MEKRDKIFLAAPFHDYMNGESGRMNQKHIELVTKVLDYLRSKGYEVHNAHEREKWGEDWYSPEQCTPIDLEKIKDSSILVAFPGNPPSGGVHIELGWASALEKRIILLLEESGTYSNLVLGLNTVSRVQTVRYKNIDDVLPQLELCLQDKSAQRILAVSDFYDKMSASYDSFMEEGESTLEDEVNLVLQTFTQPCRILDVGCGTGRIAIPLQDKGYAVTGIDVSHGMTQQAKRKGLRNALQANLEGFNHSETFDGVVSLHVGFSYTNDADKMFKMLQVVYGLLGTSGKVLWDSPNKHFYGEKKVLEWPTENGIVRTACYGHDAERIREMFMETGFSIQNIWGSYTPLTKYKKESPRIIIEAVKG
ncbi:methyltransferase domain-containing protein [Candidatus Woesearchaeota archaeon]|nr:methyltransferase domain-containing protein [Candidatus Woesearchaeota archaeon]